MKNFIKLFLVSSNANEDQARREFVLNIILLLSIAGFALLSFLRLVDIATHQNDRGLTPLVPLAILTFFVFLAWLSKKGAAKTASWLLIAAYSLPALYSFILWGADLPAALLMGVLVIAFCGILIGMRALLISALCLNAFLIILTQLHANKIISVNSYWRQDAHEIGDAITYAFFLTVITAIVWIFARENRQALERARRSERELQQERDDLEIKVIERTAKIQEMEAEKISQLYRLAEFGRLSSGIFHDLINPLTAVSLNLQQIKNESINSLNETKENLDQAITASGRMADLIAGIKKAIKQEKTATNFFLDQEIEAAIRLLAYKARQAYVRIEFKPEAGIVLFGDPVKFGQIITNLIANSIDAYALSQADGRLINIRLKQLENQAILEVCDRGAGIASENLSKIFQPFFSTKSGQGLGLGLSSTKHIVEKDFGGSIDVSSRLGQETIFTIIIPLAYVS